MDSDTASERTYRSGHRGSRHELEISDAAARIPSRLSRGEALIVIMLASLALWAAIVGTICSLASTLLP